jgi:hypothetical protein
MEKRRCLGSSSWTGGDSGRSNGSWLGRPMDIEVDIDGMLDSTEEELSPVLFPFSSSSLPSTEGRSLRLAAAGLRRDSAKDFRGAGFLAESEADAAGGSTALCRRISFSLAMTPRRRRNGIVVREAGGGGGREEASELVQMILSRQSSPVAADDGRRESAVADVQRMVATSGFYNHGHPLSVAMLLSRSCIRWENRIGVYWFGWRWVVGAGQSDGQIRSIVTRNKRRWIDGIR